MLAIFLTTIIANFTAFGAALPEPLVLLAVGAVLLVVPFLARRLNNRANAAKNLQDAVHETLTGRRD